MKKVIFCLLFVGLLVSCEDSDDSATLGSELNGKWELQSASCYCFYPEEFDFTAHKLIFDLDTGNLILENSEETFFISSAGNYDIQVKDNKIIIEDIAEFIYEIKGELLVLTYEDNPEIADDEVTLTYIKVD